ncbi:hypothetical protein DSO57_1008448 [Entomophthora muscae]|uniref:Uncharacterized protein n=1 Tax=Entomophthora muscae TaxID=34485 RepID=A0ACC2T799_9FUNG|nr:hypothetical protein DSO57_1008448 [Entomophthora muscae]
MVLLFKLTPEHPKEGAYILKESIVYQKNQIWVPKSLRARVMTEHHCGVPVRQSPSVPEL